MNKLLPTIMFFLIYLSSAGQIRSFQYKGQTLKLLHPVAENSFDSIVFNKTHDTAFIYRPHTIGSPFFSPGIIYDSLIKPAHYRQPKMLVRFYRNGQFVFKFYTDDAFYIKVDGGEMGYYRGKKFYYDKTLVRLIQ